MGTEELPFIDLKGVVRNDAKYPQEQINRRGEANFSKIWVFLIEEVKEKNQQNTVEKPSQIRFREKGYGILRRKLQILRICKQR